MGAECPHDRNVSSVDGGGEKGSPHFPAPMDLDAGQDAQLGAPMVMADRPRLSGSERKIIHQEEQFLQITQGGRRKRPFAGKG
jgi:hypothetical protein